ncbi:MAG TPA: hypothetical protein VFJ82_23740, partial [Longimicrobium sp.]|nr:hypothetical protein [Longimicrobium sp.]
GGAGAAGGLAYTLTRPATRRLGTAGDYLSGIIAMASYVGFALAVIPYLGGPRMLGDVAGVVIFVFISVLFGTVVGKMIHDGERLKKAME